MLTLAFLTASKANSGTVEDGTKILEVKKSQISTSSTNRLVRISKGTLGKLGKWRAFEHSRCCRACCKGAAYSKVMAYGSTVQHPWCSRYPRAPTTS